MIIHQQKNLHVMIHAIHLHVDPMLSVQMEYALVCQNIKAILTQAVDLNVS